ncbi:PEP/pyruvate-binding domain-containing protein [Candidatus Riflebacteria bacterium]
MKKTISIYYSSNSGITDIYDGNLASLGGKGRSLAKLDNLGYKVPRFFVLPEDYLSIVFKSYFSEVNKHLKKKPAIAYKKAKQFLDSFKFSSQFKKKIEASLKIFSADSMIAIRSSAVCEDAVLSSYAGMFETYLFIKPSDLKIVLLAIKSSMLSLFAERVLEYRKSSDEKTRLGMALVFQQMVFPEVSGVAFSINSIEKNPEEVLINSVFGVGEGLVSGELNGDTFYYNYLTEKIRRQIANKSHKLVFNEEKGSGLKKVSLPTNEKKAASLMEPNIKKIAREVIKIEKDYNRPMDIEWAIRENQLFILQARPITQLHTFPFGRKMLWDNSNIVESYSDITSPLTFSFICRAYQVVYTQFGYLVGMERAFAQEHERFFSNYLGSFNGRVYYNLATWYGGLALLPGFGFTKGAMEGMMGVKESFDYGLPQKEYSTFEKYFIELPRFARTVFLIIRAFTQSESMFIDFQKIVKKYYDKYIHYNFNDATPEKLLDIYWELVGKVMWNWKAPIVADCQSMVFYGLLKKLVKSWCNENEGLANDLLAGTGDIESKLPIEELIKGGQLVKKSPVLISIFEKTEPEDLFDVIQNNPECVSIKAWLANYLEKYGLRAPNELKLEEETYKENPFLLMQMLKNYASMDMDLEAMKKKELKLRQIAEKKVARALGKTRVLSGLISKKRIFNWVLKNARLGIRNRENQRFARTKMYGLMRLLFNGMGHAFFQRKIIAQPKDIFYLKIEEIFEFIDGKCVLTNLGELVSLRKKEYDRYQNREPDERFFTWGIPYHENTFKYERKRAERKDLKENQLAGIGVCPGIIRGEVILVHSPKEKIDLRGKIMVCQKTDPGWVPLFPISKGILVEKGSVLSHSAIVSREMGLPAIVGVDDLFKKLKTGDIVEFDGSSGIITMIEKKRGKSKKSSS